MRAPFLFTTDLAASVPPDVAIASTAAQVTWTGDTSCALSLAFAYRIVGTRFDDQWHPVRLAATATEVGDAVRGIRPAWRSYRHAVLAESAPPPAHRHASLRASAARERGEFPPDPTATP